MNRIQRCQRFARKALDLIEAQGESFESIKAIVTDASKVILGASDKTLKTCEWAGAILNIRTIGTIRLWLIYEEPESWNNPEKIKLETWAEIRSILSELVGEAPLTTHARKREQDTSRWVYMCDCARRNEAFDMYDEVVKHAIKTYPDFDLSLLGSPPDKAQT